MAILTVPPNSLGWREINACIAVTVLATAAVALRFFTRLYKKIKLGSDDWAALITLILLLIMFIQMILWVFIGGQGYHLQELLAMNPSIVTVFSQVFYANEVTYAIASPAVKITVVLFYRRIFPIRYFRIISDITIFVAVLWGISMFVGSSTQCIPLAKAWDRSIPGTCFDAEKFILGMAGANIIFDTVILIMPIKPIWGLHRPWQDRIALTGVFLVGGFVCFASMYRIATLLAIDFTDLTYSTHEGAIWTFLEPCIGLVCGCLPVIRGLLPAYTVKRPDTCMSTKMRTQIFPFNTEQETYISSTKLNNTTQEYSRTTSADSVDDLPMEGTDKIRVYTTINIQR